MAQDVPLHERMFRRVQNALGVGKTTTPANDAGPVQTVQVRLNPMTIRDAVPVMHLAGLSICPLLGTDLVLVCLSGDASKPIAIASNHQDSRPRNLSPGETMLYDAGTGSQIYLRADRSILLKPSGGIVEIEGELHVSGDVTSNGGAVSLNGHVHSGVKAGSDDTQGPVGG